MQDDDLVKRARTGDLSAANDLLERYQDVAYTAALRLLGVRSEAQDIAQEALVRAYTHLSELETHAAFGPWLRRIAVNLSLNALRKRGQLRFESLDEPRPSGARAILSTRSHSHPTQQRLPQTI